MKLVHNSSVSSTLFHFSEDPSIEKFVPHVPRTNPTVPPAVWAIDEKHSPLYWFPRACPRVAAWPRDVIATSTFQSAFCTTASRIHAIECRWLNAFSKARLYRYTLPAESFVSWPEATGQWISHSTLRPTNVVPIEGLLELHGAAGIELRIVPNLWPLHDLAVSGPWDFSIVRMSNALPDPRA